MSGMQTQWFVYIIRCVNNTLYTGITTDIERRLNEHAGDKTKGAKYLRGRGPLTLVWHAAVDNRSEASRLESLIKQLPRQTKQRLIDGHDDVRQRIGLTA